MDIRWTADGRQCFLPCPCPCPCPAFGLCCLGVACSWCARPACLPCPRPACLPFLACLLAPWVPGACLSFAAAWVGRGCGCGAVDRTATAGTTRAGAVLCAGCAATRGLGVAAVPGAGVGF